MRSRYLVTLLAVPAVMLTGCGSDSGGSSAGGSSDISLVSSGTLTVCSDVPYKPFEYTENGKYTGFDIDLMKQIADGMGLKLQIKDSGFDGIQSGASLNAGQCDVAASAMTITKDREKHLDFSKPYYNSQQSLLVPKGSDIKGIDDLSGKKVGIQQGTTGADYAKEHVPEGTKLVSFPSDAELYPAIKAGNIDAILQDLPVNVQHVEDGGFEIVQKYDTNEHYGFAVKEEGSEALLKQINQTLAKLKKNGEYKKLYNQYFSTQ